jgi:TolB-like protein
LTRAAELYRGELLSGLTIHDSEFEDWLAGERLRLHQLFEDALSRLLAQSMAGGAWDLAVVVARRRLALDPLCEAAFRALMQVHAARAQTVQALKLYETLRDRLHSELGVKPEPETLELYEAIRQRRPTIITRAASGFSADLMDKPKSSAQLISTGPLPLPSKPSTAVLPFQNLSDDPEQEYFADGLTEDIITALSRVSGLTVIARTSSFVYKGQTADIKRVARELSVGYVMEGSVRRAGHRLRVTAQLIDGATGHHVWAERYDRPAGDIFDIQDEIMRSVAASTEIQIQLSERLAIE